MKRTTLLVLAVSLGLGACEIYVSLGHYVEVSAGATSGSSSSGGCSDSSECSIPAGTCYPYGTATCDAGQCQVTYDVAQVYGNCRKNYCDSMGNIASTADDTNTYDDGTGCTVYPCDGGIALPPIPLAIGTPCPYVGTNWIGWPHVSGYCMDSPDSTQPGLVLCTSCDPNTMPTTCGAPWYACEGGECVPAGCVNGMGFPNESDVGCGGGDCLPCDVGKKCVYPNDCLSYVCVDGGCAAPTCTDGQWNGLEAYVDCGGPVCPKCPDAPVEYRCILPRDCISGICFGNDPPGPNLCKPPSCHDGVQNGSETGIDCGGDGGCNPCGPDGG